MSVLRSRKQKTSHALFFNMAIDSLRPSPENDTLYRPVLETDPAIVALAEDIKRNGVLDPIVVTLDHVILSGHRRYAAATLAGLLEVPVREHPIRSTDSNFVPLLTSYNKQREKNNAERLREAVVEANQSEAVAAYQSYRVERSLDAINSCNLITLGYRRPRTKISKNRLPLLNAVIEILKNELADFLPTTIRTIHYQLLNRQVLKVASKPGSSYRNDKKSYVVLTKVLASARIEGYIPQASIKDETRPVTIWGVHNECAGFFKAEFGGFLKGYWRDLLQSQPNHIEVIGEKNTIESIIRPVCMNYTVPYTIGRGYSSIPPRFELLERFKKSGKEKLVLVILSDFDPDGDTIAQSFAHSLRDDFGIPEDSIVPIRAALNPDQVKALNLPVSFGKAKKTSKQFNRFIAKHGSDAVYELEAVPPLQLQKLLEDTLKQVIDTERFNEELEAEEKDQCEIENTRRRVIRSMRMSEGGEP